MPRLHALPLRAALLSAFSALGTTASAVHLGNDGTGQVLIYPYYTVRTAGPGDWATYLNVVNHTTDTKALRLRFREGKNGRSVFDTNLYLGSGDVWTGAVARTTDGAQLLSADASCVTASGSFAQSVAAGKLAPAFSNSMYIGASTTQAVFDGYDGADSSLDRTREGFFEIIEMGVVTNAAIVNGLRHGDAGTPANCGVVANINASALGAPRGGLSGGASLIHVLKGSDFGYEPVVLEDFYRPANAGDNLWTAPGEHLPDLSQATPVSRLTYLHKSETAGGANGMVTDVLETAWDRGIDAVSALLMHDSIKNTYVLDAATQSSTDWIITLPTKHHYISANAPGTWIANDPNGAQLLSPFNFFFWNGTYELMDYLKWDRESQTPSSDFSLRCGPYCFSIRWQSNVGSFGNLYMNPQASGTLLGSSLRFPEWGSSSEYLWASPAVEHGWATIGFMLTSSVVSRPLPRLLGRAIPDQTQVTYFGLPVVGFMVHDFVNTNVTINGLPSASSYGGNFNHKYTRDIRGGNVRP